jgi:hypothetical protein
MFVMLFKYVIVVFGENVARMLRSSENSCFEKQEAKSKGKVVAVLNYLSTTS